MRKFEGTVRIRFDAENARVFLDRGISTSVLTADDADKIVAVALEAASKYGAKLDRWCFYVRGENEKLPKNAKALVDPKSVLKALKAGCKPNIILARFGKPACWIQPEPQAKTTKASKFTDLA